MSGPGTAFDQDRICRLEDIDAATILVIEVAESNTHWMAPGDLDVDAIQPAIVKGLEGDGVHVLFADGSVWFLGEDVPLSDLQKFFTIEGAKQHDRDDVLVPYAVFENMTQ